MLATYRMTPPPPRPTFDSEVLICIALLFVHKNNYLTLPLNVVPLKLTGPFGHHYVTEGAPFAEFRYIVLTGNHLPYFLTWKLNSSVFNGNTRISLFNDSKTLVLRFPSRVDSGIYADSKQYSGQHITQLDSQNNLYVVCEHYACKRRRVNVLHSIVSKTSW